jgi:hypothetical protein
MTSCTATITQPCPAALLDIEGIDDATTLHLRVVTCPHCERIWIYEQVRSDNGGTGWREYRISPSRQLVPVPVPKDPNRSRRLRARRYR